MREENYSRALWRGAPYLSPMSANNYYRAYNEETGKPISDKETLWAMLTHLSILTGHVSGIGFFLGPFLIWLIQKDVYPTVDRHFREAINFQISLFLYGAVLSLFIFVTLGLGVIVAGPILFILWVIDIVLPIRAALWARDGKFYRYPLTIRIV